MKKKIVMLLGSSGDTTGVSVDFYARAFRKLGYLVEVIQVKEKKGLKKVEKAVSSKNFWFFISFNVILDDYVKPFRERGLLHVNLIDTPLNKVDKLLSYGKNSCVFILNSLELEGLKSRFNFQARLLPLNSTALVNEHAGNLTLKQREIDLLFAGTLRDYYSNSGIRQIKNRIFADWITNKILFGRKKAWSQLVFEVYNNSLWKKLGLLELEPNCVEDLLTVWKLMHSARNKKRRFVLNRLLSLPDIFKLMFVIPSANKDYVDAKRKNLDVTNTMMSWNDLVNVMRNTRLFVHVGNFQNNIIHEKVATAMACGAAVLTDRNKFLESEFKEGKDIFFIDYEKEDVAQKVVGILSDENKLQRVAKIGQKKILARHMPINRAKYIVDEVKKYQNSLVLSSN